MTPKTMTSSLQTAVPHSVTYSKQCSSCEKKYHWPLSCAQIIEWEQIWAQSVRLNTITTEECDRIFKFKCNQCDVGYFEAGNNVISVKCSNCNEFTSIRDNEFLRVCCVNWNVKRNQLKTTGLAYHQQAIPDRIVEITAFTRPLNPGMVKTYDGIQTLQLFGSKKMKFDMQMKKLATAPERDRTYSVVEQSTTLIHNGMIWLYMEAVMSKHKQVKANLLNLQTFIEQIYTELNESRPNINHLLHQSEVLLRRTTALIEKAKSLIDSE